MSGFPLPRIDGANAPYWEGARAGRLMLQQCLDCGTHRFPASRYCAHCHGDRSAWVQASGEGVVESFCTFHKPYWPGTEGAVPYDVVQVRLKEGVQLFSNLVGAAQGAVRIGMAVVVQFEAVTPEVTLVKFREAT